MVLFPLQQFLDNDGNPLSGGTVTFYNTLTTDLKEVYDETADPIENPQVLDAGGYVRDRGVYLGSGDYRIVIESEDETFVKELDPWYGDKATVESVSIGVVDNIADLKALDTTALDYDFYMVLGYYVAGDFGGGMFRYIDSSSATDDGGFFIEPDDDSGRWIRDFNEGSMVTPIMFGIKSNDNANYSPRWAKMTSFCFTNKVGLHIPSGAGYYYIGANLQLGTGDAYAIDIEDGAKFNGTTSGLTLTINTNINVSELPLVDGTNVKLVIAYSGLSKVWALWFNNIDDAFSTANNTYRNPLHISKKIEVSSELENTLLTLVLEQNDPSEFVIEMLSGAEISCANIIGIGYGGYIGGVNKYKVFTQQATRASWFFSYPQQSDYTGEDLDAIQQSATWIGERGSIFPTDLAEIIWDVPVKFITDVNIGSYADKVYNSFNGGYIESALDLVLGYIKDESINCLQTTGAVSILNDVINAKWFLNKDELLLGIANGKKIDLNGMALTCIDSAELDSGIEVYNGSISIGADIADYGIFVEGTGKDCVFKDVKFTNLSAIPCVTALDSFKNVLFDNVIMENSVSGGGSINITGSATKANLVNSAFRADSTIFDLSSFASVEGCLFENVNATVIDGNAKLNSSVGISIIGNKFKGVNLLMNDAVNAIVSCNSFESRTDGTNATLYLIGAGTDLASNFIVKDNIFKSIATPVPNIFISGFADDGHINTVIVNNPCSGAEYSTVAKGGSVKTVTSASDVDFTDIFTTLVLPFSFTPNYAKTKVMFTALTYTAPISFMLGTFFNFGTAGRISAFARLSSGTSDVLFSYEIDFSGK